MHSLGSEQKHIDGGQLRKSKIKQLNLIIVEQPLLELEAANFITQVKLIPGHEQTPVVVIAASKDNEAKKQVRSAGGAGWLVQPLQPQQFIRMLEGFKARKAKMESETKS